MKPMFRRCFLTVTILLHGASRASTTSRALLWHPAVLAVTTPLFRVCVSGNLSLHRGTPIMEAVMERLKADVYSDYN